MMYTTAKHMSKVYSEIKFDVDNARNVRDVTRCDADCDFDVSMTWFATCNETWMVTE